jgi:diguanylate cyclase (GGDEF)-like protein
VWVHVTIFACIGAMPDGARPQHAIGSAALLAPLALLAGCRWLGRRARQLCAAVALLTSSAMVVHLSGGMVEAHFHYFVVIAVLSLYEDWILFFVSLVYVLIVHVLMSVADPSIMLGNGGNPWVLSAVHASAITLLGAVSVLNWRLNEDVRTAESEVRSRLAHTAVHDELTGLPNRRLLAQEMSLPFPAQGAAAVFVDLDNFKVINDSYGHRVGDQLLVDVAARLLASVRGTDFVARSGGDEFVVLARPVHGDQAMRRVAARLMAAFDEPFEIAGSERKVNASIGVSAYDGGSVTATDALARADAAMYLAKSQGRGRVQMADDRVLTEASRRMVITDALRNASRTDFEVHYQPVVDLTDGSVNAVEALVRWTHAELGPISPGEFIPIAEECGRILDLGRWVLDRACREALRWEELCGRPVQVFVNISGSQINHPDFSRAVRDTFASTGARPGNIALELTETAALDLPLAAANVAELNDACVDLILDDFGVGFSTLEYLTQFPVALIKLDRLFVSDPASLQHRAILGAVVELGRGLLTPTLAEGIETMEQLELVRDAEFQFGQGYLFARPQPPRQLDELLVQRRPYREMVASVAAGAPT